MNGDGVAYLIHRGPMFCPVAASRGRLAPGGECWHGVGIDGGGASLWGRSVGARYFTAAERAERESLAAELGGEWVEVLVEIPAGEGR
jgi:hypothetical protein